MLNNVLLFCGLFLIGGIGHLVLLIILDEYILDKLIEKLEFIEYFEQVVRVDKFMKFTVSFLWLFLLVCFYGFSRYELIEETPKKLELVEEYKIVKGQNQTNITGNGMGFLTYYQMSFDSKDSFSFYYYLDETDEYAKKTVDFDFKIKEIDKDQSYYRVYEKNQERKYSSRVFGEYTELWYAGREEKLYVPKGTVTNGSGVTLD